MVGLAPFPSPAKAAAVAPAHSSDPLAAQAREVSDVESALGLPAPQVLALFNKTIRKLHSLLKAGREHAIAAGLPPAGGASALAGKRLREAVAGDLEEELAAGAAAQQQSAEVAAAAAAARELLRPEMLGRYEIQGGDADWDDALTRGGGKLLSVRRPASAEEGGEQPQQKGDKKSGKKRKEKGGPLE